MAAVVSLSFLIRPLLELSLRPGPGLWGPGTPLVCPAPCTVACPEGHCSAGPGRWLVLPPLLPVVTIPTVPSGAARLPREGRGWQLPAGVSPSARWAPHQSQEENGVGSQAPAGPEAWAPWGLPWGARWTAPCPAAPDLGLGRARGPPCTLLSPDAPLQRRREGVTRGRPPSSSTVRTRRLFSPCRVRTRLSSLSGLRWVSVAFREKFQ